MAGHCILASTGRGLVIVAAQNTKQRQRLAIKERTYNRQYKSAVRTRMKKVGSWHGYYQDSSIRSMPAVHSKPESQERPIMLQAMYSEAQSIMTASTCQMPVPSNRGSSLNLPSFSSSPDLQLVHCRLCDGSVSTA